MSDFGKAVFLSYASQDADAAKRICDALRTAGVEVWFDQAELVGGDAWDAKIRGQIGSCALIVPVVSANTQARQEGYFRLEWKLAEDRSHLIAKGVPFIVPVSIDGTSERGALVPDAFKAVQWTKLPAGETSAAFVARVKNLLSGPSAPAPTSVNVTPSTKSDSPSRNTGFPVPASVAVAAVVLGLVAFFALRRSSNPPAASHGPSVAAVTSASRPPAPVVNAKSVAVLAFTNLSDDKDNEYFSDGISEELLNVLAKVPGLKVSARTSAFSFKGKGVAIPEIAKQLGVAYVVEGSVRKAGHRVRITAQLIKASDGFHVWSDNFDRELKDIFAVQDEIAGLIAGKLQVSLGAALRVAREVNPRAHRLVLEGRHFWGLRSDDGFDRAEKCFQQAAEIDPRYADAFAGLALVEVMRVNYAQVEGRRVSTEVARGQALARQAIELEPALAEPHGVLGYAAMLQGRWADAAREYEIAQRLSPGSALWESWRAYLEVNRGRIDLALPMYDRAAALDPLWTPNLWTEAIVCEIVGLHARAIDAADRVIALRPEPDILGICYAVRAQALLGLGRRAEAAVAARTMFDVYTPERRISSLYAGMPGVLKSVGMEKEATTLADQLLARLEPDNHVRGLVLAGWGRYDEALRALENTPPRSYHDLYWNARLDPLRGDPRFKALLQKLGCSEEYQVARAAQAKVLGK